ncbi:radical SAM protein [Bdellovibrio sp. HCB337]|uniref:radical SAM protein n=1 Tax=Bdellovibrio sp. HCB337 TaxID=3394358 RepID=UPI0039A73781
MFSVQTYTSILKALITKKSPYYVQFYIIGKCNLMCRQCNIVETNSRIEAMPIEQIRETAKNLRKVGAGIVLLTGGEPFMRHDLPEIVEAFTREKLNVRLQTAGTKFATEEKLRACYEAGARDINVSVDSLDHNTFDYINAVPGSSQNAINTIELISNVFRKKSAILSFGTVLSRFNYREIPAILEFAKRIGWQVSLVPVHIASSEKPKGFRSYDGLFKFGDQHFGNLEELKSQLIQLKRQKAPLFDSEWFLESSISFLKGNGPTWRKDGVCDSPNLYFAVRPNGDFTTCCDYTLKNPPKLYSPDFVEKYKKGEITLRQDVQDIVRNCSGCHYGSYPEVTLSVRDPKAFVERSFMVLSSGAGKLSSAPVQSDFLGEIEKIKKDFPQVYPKEQWIDTDIKDVLSTWRDVESRREIIKRDLEKRKQQGRVRGEGEDVLISSEKKV